MMISMKIYKGIAVLGVFGPFFVHFRPEMTPKGGLSSQEAGLKGFKSSQIPHKYNFKPKNVILFDSVNISARPKKTLRPLKFMAGVSPESPLFMLGITLF
jgi:hypothetical protein